MSKSRKSIPHVVVNTVVSVKACRDKLRGVLKYARLHGPWLIHLVEGRSGEQQLNEIRQWGGTGIISETTTDLFEKAVIEARLPTVLLDPIDSHCVAQNHTRCRCF